MTRKETKTGRLIFFLYLRQLSYNMSFEPRVYQSEAVKAVLQAYGNGQRQLLLRLPTGAGKTVISALIIQELLKQIGERRILFLAHRKEIIDQTADKISRLLGDGQVAIEQADRRAHADARVVIASVQTLAGRLTDYPAESFQAIIIDECHHAYAKTWMDTISHFGKQKSTLLLGLTATSKRSDGRCVSELFSETAFEISMGELQEQGFLVPMDYYQVEAALGLGALSMDQNGEFPVTLLGRIMNSPELRGLTIKAWMERAAGKKTIVFCASLKHAEELTQDFLQLGVNAAFVSGQSSDRDAIIQTFREGDIQVLSNFGVLTEGFDDPSVECVLLARPTTSPLVYSQCLGRGLRTYPGKTSCTVIDIVDRQQHQLQYNAFEAAGLSRSWRGSGKDPLREAEAIARIRVTDPAAFLQIKRALSLDETQRILTALDPRTVLAGIDGMPLVRYQPLRAGVAMEADEVRALVGKIFQEAELSPSAWELAGNSVKAVLFEDEKSKVSPYLAWHVNQATACTLAVAFEPRPITESIVEPIVEPLPRMISEPIPESIVEPLPGVISEPIPEAIMPLTTPKASMGLKSRLEKIINEGRNSIPKDVLPSPRAASKASGSSMLDKLRALKDL